MEIHILDFLSRHLDPSGVIVEMKDYFEDDDNFYVVMKYFDNGIGMDLFDFVRLILNMKCFFFCLFVL